MDMRRRLDRERNPFFKHAEAEYLIAWRDGQPVGRISAHIDHRFNDFQDNRWGLFGFFECEDSPETPTRCCAPPSPGCARAGAI